MSKLTEIMKQIPLDELTGDVEMKESRNNRIEVSGGGAMVKRRIGVIGTAAACAVVAAGGAFAYSKLSKSPSSSRAEEITSAAQSSAYERNLEIYRYYYEKVIGTDFDTVKDFISPLSEESEVSEYYGLKMRVIGTRSAGPFIQVDVCVENPEKQIYYLRRAPYLAVNASLTLQDGTVLNAVEENPRVVDSDDEIRVVSYVFPKYKAAPEDIFSALESGEAKLDVSNITVVTDDEDKIIKSFSSKFTLNDKTSSDSWTDIRTDTAATLPSMLPGSTEDTRVRIKRICCSPVGVNVMFSLEGVTDEYRQQVKEALCDKGLAHLLTEEFGTMMSAASDQGTVCYIANDPAGKARLILSASSAESGYDFVLSRDFLGDPLPVEQITKFVFGREAAEVAVPVKEVNNISNGNLEAYKAYFEDMNIDYEQVKDTLFVMGDYTPTVSRQSGDAKLDMRMIGYRAEGPFVRVDMGITSDKEEYEFKPEEGESARLYLSDGRYVEGTLINGVNPKAVSFEFALCGKDSEGKELFAPDGDRLRFTFGRQDEDEDLYSAEFTYNGSAGYDHTFDADAEMEIMPFVTEMSHIEKVRIKSISYSNTGAFMIFTVEDMDEEYQQKIAERICGKMIYELTTVSEKTVTAVENSGFETYLFTAKQNLTGAMVCERLDSGDFVVYRECFDAPLKASEIKKFRLGLNQYDLRVKEQKDTDESSAESNAPAAVEELNIRPVLKMHYGKDMNDHIAEISLIVEELQGDIDFDRTVSVVLPNGNKVGLELGSVRVLGDKPENNINYQSVYTGLLPLTKLGVGNGDVIKLTVDDLYDKNGTKLAEGHYEKEISIELPDSNSYHSYQQLLDEAVIPGWTDESGEHQFDKSGAKLYDGSGNMTQSGFEGMSIGKVAEVSAEGRYYAPVIEIICDRDADGQPTRDSLFLSTEPDKALSVTNKIYLKSADGKQISPLGEGWKASGKDAMICAPTFDVSELGLKPGDKATLVISHLLTGGGDTIAQGEFTAEITMF